MLLSEKEHGLQRLNGSVEAGEKLYPDTASTGREKIRQDLRHAKEDWERLFNGLNEAQRQVDAFLMQWASYVDSRDSLSSWMEETEAALRADVELRNTLQEKRQQLQSYRVANHYFLIFVTHLSSCLFVLWIKSLFQISIAFKYNKNVTVFLCSFLRDGSAQTILRAATLR